jgi:hypothetical protein
MQKWKNRYFNIPCFRVSMFSIFYFLKKIKATLSNRDKGLQLFYYTYCQK